MSKEKLPIASLNKLILKFIINQEADNRSSFLKLIPIYNQLWKDFQSFTKFKSFMLIISNEESSAFIGINELSYIFVELSQNADFNLQDHLKWVVKLWVSVSHCRINLTIYAWKYLSEADIDLHILTLIVKTSQWHGDGI